jgi:hypothetical protein
MRTTCAATSRTAASRSLRGGAGRGGADEGGACQQADRPQLRLSAAQQRPGGPAPHLNSVRSGLVAFAGRRGAAARHLVRQVQEHGAAGDVALDDGALAVKLWRGARRAGYVRVGRGSEPTAAAAAARRRRISTGRLAPGCSPARLDAARRAQRSQGSRPPNRPSQPAGRPQRAPPRRPTRHAMMRTTSAITDRQAALRGDAVEPGHHPVLQPVAAALRRLDGGVHRPGAAVSARRAGSGTGHRMSWACGWRLRSGRQPGAPSAAPGTCPPATCWETAAPRRWPPWQLPRHLRLVGQRRQPPACAPAPARGRAGPAVSGQRCLLCLQHSRATG